MLWTRFSIGRRALIPASIPFLLLISILAAGASFAAPADPAGTRRVPASKLFDRQSSLMRSDRIVVKFAEGTGVRLRGGALTSARADLGALRAWLAAHPGITVSRHFARDEAALDRDRADGERRGGVRLADLNLYYELRLPASGGLASARDAALATLRSMPHVELAFAEPIAEPARAAGAVTTPDYSAQQGYLYASPNGINAQAVWGFAGGRGAGVKIIDIEGAWLWTHEDLPAPFFTGGTPIADLSWRNHGTAVMGVMTGRPNGFGVTGIATDMQAGAVSIGDMSVAAAIDLASSNLDPGDLFLIELHAPGPNATGSGQFGYVPMEFWQDNFDAIQTAVANGRICIEAGGNGEQDLDGGVYQGLFDRAVRNSGAIMVGAGTPTGHVGEWFTNFGSRLDLNGWGSSVTTCGYGALQGGAETQWYTNGFNGTSSASPVVSGAVASLQGMSEATWGIPLSGPLAAQILYQTGTPWSGTKRIGRRPNLVAARTLLLEGIGAITGTVHDLSSGLPIAGADVQLVEPGVLVRTDASGYYHAPLLSGSYTVRVSEFFHATNEQSVPLASGETSTHDVYLALKPAGAVAGVVLTEGSEPVAGARARVIGVPLAPDTTGAGGSYLIGGIPADTGYQAIYGLVPGRGAAASGFDVTEGNTSTANAKLVPAETFETGAGGYTGGAPWQRGTPTIGPAAAFSGSRLWATGLNANYADNVTAYLTSGSYNFAGATKLTFSFTHFYDTEAGFDGGKVQVWSGGTWVNVAPVGGYPLDFLAGLANGSGYSGTSNGWQPAVFDLTPYISADVRVRFWFGSDSGVNGPGWYVDDVAFDAITAAVSVESPGAPGHALLLAGAPNPFSAATTLSFQLPSRSTVALRVFDASGRLVRVLASGEFGPGQHAARWDGTDANGHAVASGAYFGVLEAGGREIGSERLLLLR